MAVSNSGNSLEDLRRLLRSRREELGFSRAVVADRIFEAQEGREISERTIQWLENECQRMPAAEVLRPVSDALELDWEEVLRVAGY